MTHDHSHHDHAKKDKECCGDGSCEKGECAGEHHEKQEDSCGCGHHHGHEKMRMTAIKPRVPNTSGIVGDGDVVMVHYTGTLDDGKQFDTNTDKDPLEVTIGEHAVIKGFEQGLIGMKPGEKKKVTIEAMDAYGDENPELRQALPKEAFGDITPEVGMMLALQHPAAPMPIPVRVAAVDGETVTIDMNHPLAGKRLHFELEVVEIK